MRKGLSLFCREARELRYPLRVGSAGVKAMARAPKTDGSSVGFPTGSMVGKRTATEYVKYVD